MIARRNVPVVIAAVLSFAVITWTIATAPPGVFLPAKPEPKVIRIPAATNGIDAPFVAPTIIRVE